MSYKEKIVKMLFETKAFRVSHPKNPFWYTSGAIGPFYINTHFLYGSEEKATNLLSKIDDLKSDILNCPSVLLDLVRENYNKDNIYKELIDLSIDYVKNNIDLDKIKFISGGERRDWFFSLIIADILGKKHVTIYKDQKTILTTGSEVFEIKDLKNDNVLHIADLLNEASSYVNAWIPAIENKNGKLTTSLVIVNRKQGGDEIILKENVISHSLIDIDENFFEEAKKMNLINDRQKMMILNYLKNPKKAMEDFLTNNPKYLEESLNSEDVKTRLRAKLCIEKKIYKI